MTNVCMILLNIAKFLFWGWYHFTFPPAVCEHVYIPVATNRTGCQTFTTNRWYFSVVLNSIYYKWVEHFFKGNGLFSFLFLWTLFHIFRPLYSRFPGCLILFFRNSHILGLWILCGKCFLQVCLFLLLAFGT